MAIKTIILLRHGQYVKDPTEQLSELGRKQAELAGQRLKSIALDKFHVSTMPRAIETADIVKNCIGYTDKKIFYSKLVRECVPGFPVKLRKKYGHTDLAKLKKQKKVADQAFKKLFTYSKIDTNELIVCHGNIIRYFVCKALGVKTDLWTRFDIKQCGLTVIQLDSKTRQLSVISHNDIGHIPLVMQTFI